MGALRSLLGHDHTSAAGKLPVYLRPSGALTSAGARRTTVTSSEHWLAGGLSAGRVQLQRVQVTENWCRNDVADYTSVVAGRALRYKVAVAALEVASGSS